MREEERNGRENEICAMMYWSHSSIEVIETALRSSAQTHPTKMVAYVICSINTLRRAAAGACRSNLRTGRYLSALMITQR